MCKYCITDMIRAQEGGDMERTNVVIQNWMRLKDTIEFLGFWEQLSNPKFNCIEFEAIKASGWYEPLYFDGQRMVFQNGCHWYYF